MIIEVRDSPEYNKRFRATVQTRYAIKFIDFGYRFTPTYIDDGDETKKLIYRYNHLRNPNENVFIEKMIPSASLLSYALLYGKYPSLKMNVEHLNEVWKTSKDFNEL